MQQSTSEDSGIIRETHELVRRIHRLLWWQRFFAWMRFIVFIVVPLVLVWAVLPRVGEWQQQVMRNIAELQRQFQPSTGQTPSAAATLEQWCRQYCVRR